MASPTDRSADIAALRDRASQVRIQLDELSYQTELASENYFEAQQLLEDTTEKIEQAQVQLADNQEQLEYVQGHLSERAVSSYQHGDLSLISFLFRSSSVGNFMERVDLLRTIMDNDADMIRQARQLRAEIESSKNQLEQKREIEREAAARTQAEFETVQRSLREQQRVLSSIDSQMQQVIDEQRAAIEEEQRLAAQQRAEEEARERRAAEEAQRAAAAQQPAPQTPSQNEAPPANSGGNNNAGNNGAANSGGPNSSVTTPPPSQTVTPPPTPAPAPSLGRERPGVVNVARRFVGVTPSLWGGTTPAGFDCSGLVQFSYREAYGINLPRTSRQQFNAGVFIPPNRSDLMRPGDLVFFSRTGRPADIHHVGIFVGNGRMIHAPSSGRLVSEQSMWRVDFIGAVRP